MLHGFLALVVHMGQGVFQLEVRMGNGAGAEEDREGDRGMHCGGRSVGGRIVVGWG